MTTDAAFDTLREHGATECTAQFWVSDTPARSFTTLRECLHYLGARATDEPMPDVHVHAATGELAINGEELEHLIAAAKATRPAI
ncbi:hypothetical protein [Bosea sp. PAMC 26642]|uniref:hypothetical protein n=1 Tax=Bosea sp. (strain PAMC 26642) TaxID=1792307 RepID=UPI0007704037|nr:hypothetical protein [Bosea sp. PAMC 26642]AMJ60935.1 hypothetical protein AXW83_12090 [Bosea sp. PAMC 26642]